MAKLFIANCTKQNMQFTYRLTDNPKRPMFLNIRYGAQAMLPQDLPLNELDRIIKAQERYGMIPVEELDRRKDYTGFVYSIDKPVPVAKIDRVINHNIGILDRRGVEIRRQTAVMANATIDKAISDQRSYDPRGLGTKDVFEVSVIEQDQNNGQTTTINEIITVDANARPGDEPVRRGRGRPRKGA